MHQSLVKANNYRPDCSCHRVMICLYIRDMKNKHPPSSVANIASIIHTIRSQRVILDSDLAAIYGASTKRLNEQVRRNSRRFPQDFIFNLNSAEFKILTSQFATSRLHGG